MWDKLKQLHLYNGWVITLLLGTGLALYLPAFRGLLADYRVSIKNIHIVLGLFSVLILIGYLPYFRSHFNRVRKQRGKKVNLMMTLALIVVWLISGMVLVIEKYIPAGISGIVLIIHDITTWVGTPIILFHVLTRLRGVLKQKAKARNNKGGSFQVDRRRTVKYVIGGLLVSIIGPVLYKWVKQGSGGMGYNEVLEKPLANEMTPLPTPNPSSNPPVGGGRKGDFRIYTVTDIPTYNERNWYFQIDGLVNYPHIYSWNEFITLKREVQISDFHCVTGWSVRNITYEGVLLKDLLHKVGTQQGGNYLKFYSGDGVYTDSLSLNQAMMDDVMVAMFMDGEIIPAEYGGPVRLIVPKMYAYKSVKWLVRIEVVNQPHLGYWQVRGYDTNAWVKK